MKDDREIAVARPTPDSTRTDRPRLKLRNRPTLKLRDQPRVQQRQSVYRARRRKTPNPLPVHTAVARTVSFRAFNIMQLRFLLWALVQIVNNKGIGAEFRANIKEFAALLGINYYERHVNEVRDAILGLADVLFYFPDGDGTWKVPAVAVRVPDIGSDGEVIVEFHPRLLEMFQRHCDGYALLHIEDYFRVAHIRAAGLITLLSSIRHFDNPKAQTFALADLRFSLGLTDRTYDRWDRVEDALKRTKRHVQERTEWRFSWEPIKRGRRVVAVRFRISDGLRFTSFRAKQRISLAAPLAR